jgi:tetratricopeptide (TPR) repeat protein
MRTKMRTLALALAAGTFWMAAAASATSLDDLAAQAKKPPTDPSAALALGRSLRQAGLYDDAVRVLRRAYSRGKGDEGVALRYEAARSLISNNQQKQALRECATIKSLSAVKQATCTAEAHLLWRRASLALPEAERALASSPDDYDALVAKGRALRLMGKSSDAKSAFQSAINASSSRYEAYQYLAEVLTGLGKSAEAAQALKKATAAAPDEPEPFLWLAELLPSGPDAQNALRKAIAIRPHYGAAHARLGDVLLDEGKTSEAETEFKDAIAVDAKQADWHAGLGRVLVAKGDAQGALREAALATKLVGNHAMAKLVEADALALKGDIDLAIESYEKSASYSRSSPDPLIHAARATLAGNRPTTARAFAERATQSFSDWAPTWVVLGDVAAATKDRTAAKIAYKKALTAKNGKIDKAAVKKKLAALK